MKRKALALAALGAVALTVAGAAVGRALYHAYPVQVSFFVALTRNTMRSWGAPPGATVTERNPAYETAAVPAPALLSVATSNAADDWPSYNRTLAA